MLGKIFQENREAKGATPSEAAAATRLKVQHIEALEAEDFSTIAASAYAKGFIKLYAEYLGLDAGPLLQDYEENFMPKSRQPLLSDDDSKPSRQPAPERREKTEPSWSLPSLTSFIPSFKNMEWPFTFTQKTAGIAAGSLAGILLVFWLIAGVFTGNDEEPPPITQTERQPAKPVEVNLFRTHVLVRNPPEPFIDEYITP